MTIKEAGLGTPPTPCVLGVVVAGQDGVKDDWDASHP